MSPARSITAVGVAAILFAVWELLDHVFLMNADMITYHLIGFLGETALAAAAIAWATHHAERAHRERQRADRLATVVAASLVASDADVSPVARLLEDVAAIRGCTREMPEVQKRLSAIEADARRIQVVTDGLKQLVSPYVQA